MGFRDTFDYLFFSCEVGRQKPDHEYYQYVEDTLNLEKETVLFFDDVEKNATAAREYGWNAEIYTEFGWFVRTLKEYNLEVKII